MKRIINNDYYFRDYFFDIKKYGLKRTWHLILTKTLNKKFISDTFCVKNFGELYEIGLEYDNKISKKELGKYYTPKDVAELMSRFLKNLNGEIICDVGCGVGNLILTYLEVVGSEEAKRLLNNKKIYLYDLDEVALEICKYSIAIIYGEEYLKKVVTKHCDFLNKNIKLPKNCKVIANPPYYKISAYLDNWKVTKIMKDSNDYYASFMEKIVKQSAASVIITPYSFIGGSKFYSLRKLLNRYNGYIYAFDNVPGNIFNGRKHGIFNSNKGNSVRAAITVVENKVDVHGFKVTPLIRFNNKERDLILNEEFLNNNISDNYQLVNNKNKEYVKCPKDLVHVYERWIKASSKKLKKYIKEDGKYLLYIPTTCRYYTVGAQKDLVRDGKFILRFDDLDFYNFIYCFFNSSFAYWYWRMFDGGINYPKSLLYNIPIFFDSLSKNNINEINNIANKMQKIETNFLIYKVNAGKKQENVKFPVEYRKKINKIFLDILNLKDSENIFDQLHKSSVFGESDGDNFE